MRKALSCLLVILTVLAFGMSANTAIGAAMPSATTKLVSVDGILEAAKQKFDTLAAENAKKAPIVDGDKQVEMAVARSADGNSALQLKLDNTTGYDLHDVMLRLQLSENLPLELQGDLQSVAVNAAGTADGFAAPAVADGSDGQTGTAAGVVPVNPGVAASSEQLSWLRDGEVSDLAAWAALLANNKMEYDAAAALPKVEPQAGELVLGLPLLHKNTGIRQILHVVLPADLQVAAASVPKQAEPKKSSAAILLFIVLFLLLLLLLLFMLFYLRHKKQELRKKQRARQKALARQSAVAKAKQLEQAGLYAGGADFNDYAQQEYALQGYEQQGYAEQAYAQPGFGQQEYARQTYNAEQVYAERLFTPESKQFAAQDNFSYGSGYEDEFAAPAQSEIEDGKHSSRPQFPQQFILALSLFLATLLTLTAAFYGGRLFIAAAAVPTATTADKADSIKAETRNLENGLLSLIDEVKSSEKRLSAPLIYEFTIPLDFGGKTYTLSGSLAYRMEIEVPQVTPQQVEAVLAEINEIVTSTSKPTP